LFCLAKLFLAPPARYPGQAIAAKGDIKAAYPAFIAYNFAEKSMDTLSRSGVSTYNIMILYNFSK